MGVLDLVKKGFSEMRGALTEATENAAARVENQTLQAARENGTLQRTLAHAAGAADAALDATLQKTLANAQSLADAALNGMGGTSQIVDDVRARTHELRLARARTSHAAGANNSAARAPEYNPDGSMKKGYWASMVDSRAGRTTGTPADEALR